MVRLVTVALMLFLTGCSTFQFGAPPELGAAFSDPIVPIGSISTDRPVIALVLSGGSLRGIAHIGVIETLVENGIRPDLIVGTSAGSIVGAIYASHGDVTRLRQVDIAEAMRTRFRMTWRLSGLLDGAPIRQFVNSSVDHRLIEDFAIPFAAVTANLKTGKLVTLNRGDAGTAAQASSAMPGLYLPVRLHGEDYLDGGLVSPVPAQVARAMGATVVIAVDVGFPPQESDPKSLWGVVFQTFQIMTRSLAAHEYRQADLVIRPALPKEEMISLENRAELIGAGRLAARDALGEIMRLAPKASTR